MLPLAKLDRGAGGQSGVNLLAITPGISLKFGRSTGRFEERCLAYAFLRAHWGRMPCAPLAYAGSSAAGRARRARRGTRRGRARGADGRVSELL
ncbi:MAG: hypothetical protein LC777_17605 [Actinobacteria bacterium]|nr:hypothetical protein [Actinomycetota bacterium]